MKVNIFVLTVQTLARGSIRVHLTMHQVLINQLAPDDPPEVYLTAKRLLAAGYERHEVVHMLAAPIAEHIHATASTSVCTGCCMRPALQW